jgi:hypothetical protein
VNITAPDVDAESTYTLTVVVSDGKSSVQTNVQVTVTPKAAETPSDEGNTLPMKATRRLTKVIPHPMKATRRLTKVTPHPMKAIRRLTKVLPPVAAITC